MSGPTEAPRPGRVPHGGDPLTLLLVEDDRADAIIVEELIADAGVDMDVTWAPSMADAEREISAARPDCILLDLHLHDTDGIDGLARIGRQDPGIPVVVLTGLNDEHFGVSAVASGVLRVRIGDLSSLDQGTATEVLP